MNLSVSACLLSLFIGLLFGLLLHFLHLLQSERLHRQKLRLAKNQLRLRLGKEETLPGQNLAVRVMTGLGFGRGIDVLGARRRHLNAYDLAYDGECMIHGRRRKGDYLPRLHLYIVAKIFRKLLDSSEK